MFVNARPATFTGVSSTRTVMSSTICSPGAMSMPVAVSSMTRFFASPVFCGVHAPVPETLVTLTNVRSAADALRLSTMRTSLSGTGYGTDGTVTR